MRLRRGCGRGAGLDGGRSAAMVAAVAAPPCMTALLRPRLALAAAAAAAASCGSVTAGENFEHFSSTFQAFWNDFGYF